MFKAKNAQLKDSSPQEQVESSISTQSSSNAGHVDCKDVTSKSDDEPPSKKTKICETEEVPHSSKSPKDCSTIPRKCFFFIALGCFVV